MSTGIVVQLLTQIEQNTARIAELLSQMQQPVVPSQPGADGQVNGNGKKYTYCDIQAESLVMMTDEKGELSYKIKGGPYMSFGVRVWPEVLTEKLGLDPAMLKPGPNPYNAMVRVQLLNESPRKVVGLSECDPPQPKEDIPF